MSDLQSENSQESSSKIKTPSKRTPTKRLSKIEKAQLESVEMIKNMGGSLDVEGGRRTRSSVRGGNSTPATPPPAKKSRPSSSTTPRRGRPKKLEIVDNDEVKVDNSIDVLKKTTEKANEDINNDKTKYDESKTKDDECKKDEIAEDQPDNEGNIVKKSDTLLEKAPDTDNEKINSKKVEEISITLPSTEEITEKSEKEDSELEKIHHNHIEENKAEVLPTPDVVVTAPTPEKKPTTNVPETNLETVEPMEVDSSVPEEQNVISISPDAITNNDTTNVKQPEMPEILTINNCTSDFTDKTIIEKNVIEKKEEDEKVQVFTNNIEKSTDELTKTNSIAAEINNTVNEKVNDEISIIIPQNDNKINSIVENDKEQQSSNENKIVTDSDEKNGNDSCEPKISSPPSSDGISHPQTCN